VFGPANQKYFSQAEKSRKRRRRRFISAVESYTIDGVIKVILALIVLVNGFFAYRLVVDLIRHKSEVRSGKPPAWLG